MLNIFTIFNYKQFLENETDCLRMVCSERDFERALYGGQLTNKLKKLVFELVVSKFKSYREKLNQHFIMLAEAYDQAEVQIFCLTARKMATLFYRISATRCHYVCMSAAE